jgi:hypothetical protein
MLTITHTHQEGTLIDGTVRGDGTANILKANGWRWGRSISSWFVPQSRDRLPKWHTIRRTRTALEEAGFDVTETIDQTTRTTADVEAGKIQRQADRVTALEHKADRKSAAEDTAWEREQRAVAALPEGGEPIKIGHHSETRHRSAIAKADTATRRAIDATADAEKAHDRADAARATTAGRYAPVTVANRIEKLGADIRRAERRITEDHYDDQRGYIPATVQQIEARTARLAPQLAELRDQLAYWEGIRAEQIASGTASNHSQATIHKGDRVRIRGHWYEVARANPKTVSIITLQREGRSFTMTTPYAEIQDKQPPI